MMEMTVEKKPFLKALMRQQSLVERRPSLPILSHVLLDAQPGKVCIRGTDMEMSLSEDVLADVTCPGSVAVPAHMLYDIVKNLPDQGGIQCVVTEKTHPESKGGVPTIEHPRLWVRNGAIEFKIPILDAKTFPTTTSGTDDFPFKLSVHADVVKKMIDDTRSSMSNEEARYSLNGIYFHVKNHRWYAVATDGRRLAVSGVDMDPAHIAKAPGAIFSRKSVHEISKILDDTSSDVTVELSPTSMRMSFSSGVFTARLLEGQFPDYEQAIPNNHPHAIELNVQTFYEAVRRVGMVSAEKNANIKVSFTSGKVTLSAQSHNGSAVDVLNVQYDGPDVSMGLNPRYIIDVCQNITGDTMLFSFDNGQKPILCHEKGNHQAKFVMMPMHVVDDKN